MRHRRLILCCVKADERQHLVDERNHAFRLLINVPKMLIL